MKITDLVPGDIYVPKNKSHSGIFIQVGVGSDCGIFCGDVLVPEKASLEFRVLVNQKDLMRNWKRLKSAAMIDAINRYAYYGEKEVGRNQYFKTSLDNLDQQTLITHDEFLAIEPLAIWDTENIYNRLKLK